MKKYRIVKIKSGDKIQYRVDKRHWFLFIPFWDIGASDMMPYYYFDELRDAFCAIGELSSILK